MFRTIGVGVLCAVLPHVEMSQRAASQQPAARVSSPVRIDVVIDSGIGERAPALFGFGGNIWALPDAFPTGVSTRILSQPALGVTRLSLGTQVLQHATSLQDLRQRLAALPVNAFLSEYKAKGGRILLILDGTPRWLSTNKSTARVVGPDEPAFNLSPPQSFAAWSDVVEAIVRHFNGTLRLNAYYEVRNEPNYFYYGSNEQFFKQYYYSVLGARRADPRALIGGPGISEFTGVATAGEASRSDADKLRLVEYALDHRFLFRQFLDYAAKTPLPELELPRLPVDFFSWHAFYIDPSRYYQSTVPYVRDALQQAGYPRNVPMINSEWNIIPVPPYAEGPVNATNVGAAFVANSLIAMQEAGVDAQSFQMYVDPGTPGYFGGMLTNHGVPRATFHAFTLFSMLKGRQVRVNSSDPWVRSVAFVDGNTVYLLISSAVPTAAMVRNTVSVVQTLRHGAFTKSLLRDGHAQAVARGQPLPPALVAQAREIESQGDQLRREDEQRADARRASPALQLVISGLGLPKRVTRYLIDVTHANVFPQLDSATRILDAATATYSGLPARLNQELRGAGLSARTSEAISRALAANSSLDRALDGISAAEQQVARRVVLATVGQLMSQRVQLLRSIEAWPGAGLRADTVTWNSVRPLRVELAPNAVVLYVVQR